MFKPKSKSSSLAVDKSAAIAAQQIEIEALDKLLLISMLCDAKSITPMTRAEARIAASYMRARQYADNQVLVKEGDKTDSDYMLWILHGEAVVESLPTSDSAPITVTVLGPGTTIGELSLMDGGPRSLTCTASGDTRCAALSQRMLHRMAQEHPEVAVKLISSVLIGVAVRMRDLTEKLKRFVRLNKTMNDALVETTIMQVLR
jgi:CRP/FNR family transcriptional regulator, cyclic AMP receptor protein